MTKQQWALIYLVAGTLCFITIFGVVHAALHPAPPETAAEAFIRTCEQSTKYVGDSIESPGVANTQRNPWTCTYPTNTQGR